MDVLICSCQNCQNNNCESMAMRFICVKITHVVIICILILPTGELHFSIPCVKDFFFFCFVLLCFWFFFLSLHMGVFPLSKKTKLYWTPLRVGTQPCYPLGHLSVSFSRQRRNPNSAHVQKKIGCQVSHKIREKKYMSKLKREEKKVF